MGAAKTSSFPTQHTLHGYITQNNRPVLLDGGLGETITVLTLNEVSSEGGVLTPDGALWLAKDLSGIVRYTQQSQ